MEKTKQKYGWRSSLEKWRRAKKKNGWRQMEVQCGAE